MTKQLLTSLLVLTTIASGSQIASLQTTSNFCPSNSQIRVQGACLDCRSIFGDCERCSFREKDSIQSLQCDKCSDGLFLLTLPSKNLMTPTNLTSLETISLCVKDCSAYAYNRVNNINTMACEFCGDTCTLCSPQYGCLQDYRLNRGYRSSLTYPSYQGQFSPVPPSSSFYTSQLCKDPRCNGCQNLDVSKGNSSYLQCDTCYLYVNNFEIGKVVSGLLKCDLCNSNKSNCLECDPLIPSDCLSCVRNFYLNSTSKSCVACNQSLTLGCKRCNQTQCLECDPGYALSINGTCTPCTLTAVNSQFWLEPIRCSHCYANNTSTCSYCDRGFLGSTQNPYGCSQKCDDGQYPALSFVELNKNQDTVKQQTCLACNSSCLTCSGASANECTSCRVQDFLQITDLRNKTGACTPRLLTAPTTPIELFVSNILPSNLSAALADPTIGSLQNPFFDLEFAISRAQEEAVQYGSGVTVDVHILLFKGDHFVIRNRSDTSNVYYFNKFKPNGNLNYNLVIKPLDCSYPSQTSVDISSICSSFVTIYNKQREQFSIDVPVSFRIENIKIDSLDSILHQNSIPPLCLNKREQCCSISSTSDSIESVDGSQICQNAFQDFLQTQESECLANVPRAMFKMRINDAADVGSPNNFTMINVQVVNIFYALNSIIGLTPIQGLVSIQGCSFSRLLICGAIVKNYYREVNFPDLRAMPITDNQRATINKIRVETVDINSRISNSLNTTYNYVPSGYKCYAQTCFSVTIDQTTFSQIPFLQPEIQSFKLVSDSNGLRHQGFILALEGFKGPITVTNSNFFNMQIPVQSCNLPLPQEKQSIDNYDQLFNSNSSFNLVQLQSLFSITNQSGDVSISKNQFSNNVMASGLFIV